MNIEEIIIEFYQDVFQLLVFHAYFFVFYSFLPIMKL